MELTKMTKKLKEDKSGKMLCFLIYIFFLLTATLFMVNKDHHIDAIE